MVATTLLARHGNKKMLQIR